MNHFSTDISSDELQNVISDSISAGQLPIATAGVRLLHRHYPHKALSFLKGLIEITEESAESWVYSHDAPSLSHVKWIMLLEFKSLPSTSQTTDSIPASVIDDLSFRLLLDSTVLMTLPRMPDILGNGGFQADGNEFEMLMSLETRNELIANRFSDTAFNFDGSITSLSSNAIEQLKRILVIHPLLFHSVISLCPNSSLRHLAHVLFEELTTSYLDKYENGHDHETEDGDEKGSAGAILNKIPILLWFWSDLMDKDQSDGDGNNASFSIPQSIIRRIVIAVITEEERNVSSTSSQLRKNILVTARMRDLFLNEELQFRKERGSFSPIYRACEDWEDRMGVNVNMNVNVRYGSNDGSEKEKVYVMKDMVEKEEKEQLDFDFVQFVCDPTRFRDHSHGLKPEEDSTSTSASNAEPSTSTITLPSASDHPDPDLVLWRVFAQELIPIGQHFDDYIMSEAENLLSPSTTAKSITISNTECQSQSQSQSWGWDIEKALVLTEPFKYLRPRIVVKVWEKMNGRMNFHIHLSSCTEKDEDKEEKRCECRCGEGEEAEEAVLMFFRRCQLLYWFGDGSHVHTHSASPLLSIHLAKIKYYLRLAWWVSSLSHTPDATPNTSTSKIDNTDSSISSVHRVRLSVAERCLKRMLMREPLLSIVTSLLGFSLEVEGEGNDRSVFLFSTHKHQQTIVEMLQWIEGRPVSGELKSGEGVGKGKGGFDNVQHELDVTRCVLVIQYVNEVMRMKVKVNMRGVGEGETETDRSEGESESDMLQINGNETFIIDQYRCISDQRLAVKCLKSCIALLFNGAASHANANTSLDTLHFLFKQFQACSSTSSTLASSSNEGVGVGVGEDDLAQLNDRIGEVLWRIDILMTLGLGDGKNVSENESSDTPLSPSLLKNMPTITKLLLSPNTILRLCLRKNDYECAVNVIEYFSLLSRTDGEREGEGEGEGDTMGLINETKAMLYMEKIKELLASKGKEEEKEETSLIDDISQICRNPIFPIRTDEGEGEGEGEARHNNIIDFVSVCVDLAASHCSEGAQCHSLLLAAERLLTNVGEGEGEGNTALLQQTIHKLRSLLDAYDRLKPLKELILLNGLETLENPRLTMYVGEGEGEGEGEFIDSDLRRHVKALRKRQHTVSQLNQAGDGMNRDMIESALNSGLTDLSNTVGGDGRDMENENDDHDYLKSFLRYVLAIGDILYLDLDGTTDKNRSKGTSYSSLLLHTPHQLVCDLVFQRKAFDTAEKIAVACGLDLGSIIADALIFSDPSTSSTTADADARTHTDTGDSDIALIESSIPLTMDIIEYLSVLSIPLACTVIMFRAPGLASRGLEYKEFVQRAVKMSTTGSVSVSGNSLAKWVSRREKILSDYIDVFVNGNGNEGEGTGAKTNIEREKCAKIARSKLLSTKRSSEEAFYVYTCDYIATYDVGRALEFADGILEDGAPDRLLLAQIQQVQTRESQSVSSSSSSSSSTTPYTISNIWRLIERLRDTNQSAWLALHLYERWDVCSCISVFESIVRRMQIASEGVGVGEALEVNNAGSNIDTLHRPRSRSRSRSHTRPTPVIQRIEKILLDLQLYRDIMKIEREGGVGVGGGVCTGGVGVGENGHTRNWTSLDVKLQTSPDSIVKMLLHKQQHQLAKRVIERFNVDVQSVAAIVEGEREGEGEGFVGLESYERVGSAEAVIDMGNVKVEKGKEKEREREKEKEKDIDMLIDESILLDLMLVSTNSLELKGVSKSKSKSVLVDGVSKLNQSTLPTILKVTEYHGRKGAGAGEALERCYQVCMSTYNKLPKEIHFTPARLVLVEYVLRCFGQMDIPSPSPSPSPSRTTMEFDYEVAFTDVLSKQLALRMLLDLLSSSSTPPPPPTTTTTDPALASASASDARFLLQLSIDGFPIQMIETLLLNNMIDAANNGLEYVKSESLAVVKTRNIHSAAVCDCEAIKARYLSIVLVDCDRVLGMHAAISIGLLPIMPSATTATATSPSPSPLISTFVLTGDPSTDEAIRAHYIHHLLSLSLTQPQPHTVPLMKMLKADAATATATDPGTVYSYSVDVFRAKRLVDMMSHKVAAGRASLAIVLVLLRLCEFETDSGANGSGSGNTGQRVHSVVSNRDVMINILHQLLLHAKMHFNFAQDQDDGFGHETLGRKVNGRSEGKVKDDNDNGSDSDSRRTWLEQESGLPMFDMEGENNMREAMSAEGISMCDSLLSQVDLLTDLEKIGIKTSPSGSPSSSASLSISISISDFSNPIKIRRLRDRLVQDDRYQLALRFATQCGVEAEPVWAKWGLAAIRLGLFKEARERLKYCLIPVSQGQGQGQSQGPTQNPNDNDSSVGMNINLNGSSSTSIARRVVGVGQGGGGWNITDSLRLLDDVIAALETAPSIAISAMKEEYRAMRRKMEGGRLGVSGDTEDDGFGGLSIDSYLHALDVPSTSVHTEVSAAVEAGSVDKGKEQSTSTSTTSGTPTSKKSRSTTKTTTKAKTKTRIRQPIPKSCPWTPCLYGDRLRECFVYLYEYGIPDQLASFCARHGILDIVTSLIGTESVSASTSASPSITHRKISTKSFFDNVLNPILQAHASDGLSSLLSAIRSRDKGLKSVGPYLTESCKHLNQDGRFEPLRQIQLFMGDRARAGLTCVKLFLASKTSLERQAYISEAQDHLIFAMTNPTASDFSSSDLSKYFGLVQLQIEVTKFFDGASPASSSSSSSSSPGRRDTHSSADASPEQYSLFSPQKKRAQISEELLVRGNFDLAFRLLQFFRLPSVGIYAAAAMRLSKLRRHAMVTELLRTIQGTVDDGDWDEIVGAAVSACGPKGSDKSAAETLLGRLYSDRAKVRGLLQLHRFKAAYLTAVRAESVADVRAVLSEAGRSGDQSVVRLCERYLEQEEASAAAASSSTK